MQPEIWKPIPDWPYEVSNTGRVRRTGPSQCNTWHGRLLKPGRKRRGYLAVDLSKNGKQKTVPVAILVCAAFHGPKPSQSHQAAHNNGNESDNRAENLRWATPQENMMDCRIHGTLAIGSKAGPAKLTEAQVLEIRRRAAAGERQQAIARDYGINKTAVSHIHTRRNWSHLP